MGVCQDFAHVAIGCLRTHGLPARYVSGYVERAPAAVGARRIGGIDSHAWLAVNVPGLGWLDVDPTNNRWADEHYVTLAVGRDYQDVTPVTGEVFGGARHKLDVFIDVERL